MKTTIQTIRDSYKIQNILTATPAVHAVKPLPAELPEDMGGFTVPQVLANLKVCAGQLESFPENLDGGPGYVRGL